MNWDDVYARDAIHRVEREEKAYERLNRSRSRRPQAQIRCKTASRQKVETKNSKERHTVHPRPSIKQKKEGGDIIALGSFKFSIRILFVLILLAFALLYFLGSTVLSYAKDSDSRGFAHSVNDVSVETEQKLNVAAINENLTDTTLPDESNAAVSEATSGSADVYAYALPGELESPMFSSIKDSEAAQVPMANVQETQESKDAAERYEELIESRNWNGVTASDFAGLTTEQKVELIGEMAHDDALESGVPASITAAQAILESGWMTSSLTTEYENYFGIKASTDGFNWKGSTWEPDECATMKTQEEYTIGEQTEIDGTFRAYDGTWDSIKDHSAYLANMPYSKGGNLYEGIDDPSKSIEEKVQILVDGGYATGSNYADGVIAVIDTYDLRRFDI